MPAPNIGSPNAQPFVVALTGLAASGKSTAASVFSTLDVPVIEVIVVPQRLSRGINGTQILERNKAGGGPTSCGH